MQDAQALEPAARLPGHHGRAVVGHERAGQLAFLKGLAQPVTEFLGAFGPVPLGMATEPGTVVQLGEQQGIRPGAVGEQHAQGAVMKVQMPEGIDVFAFITADLALLKPDLGLLRARAVGRTAAALFAQPLGFHVAEHHRIGGHRSQRGLPLGLHRQIVDMQLVTPTRVLAILRPEHFAQRGTQS